MLAELSRDRQHRYLEPLPSLPSVQDHFRRLVGHNQVIDAYLVAVAATSGAVLLTLDRQVVAPDSVRESVEALVSDRF